MQRTKKIWPIAPAGGLRKKTRKLSICARYSGGKEASNVGRAWDQPRQRQTTRARRAGLSLSRRTCVCGVACVCVRARARGGGREGGGGGGEREREAEYTVRTRFAESSVEGSSGDAEVYREFCN